VSSRSALALVIALAALPALSGCGLLLGNIKASARKSNDYDAIDLSKGSSDWRRLDPAKESSPADAATTDSATDVSDLSFQSQKTASIVSLTSTCRAGTALRGRDLRADTRQLLLGFTHITLQDEKELEVGGRPALQTTVQGRINSRPMRIRAVVLEAENCIYDLMLIARPDRFETVEADFGKFVSSFRLD
jgi:hypothetical protein